MRRSWWAIAIESMRLAQATSLVSGVVAVLAAMVPVVVLGVTGLGIEAQAAILSRVDDAGTRVVSVISTDAEVGLPTAAVERIGRLEGVTWVVGLGPVVDVRNSLGLGPVPLRAMRAVRPPVVFSPELTTGPNAAYVSPTSAARASLAGAFGALTPGSYRVVGWFAAGDPLGELESFVIAPSTDDSLRLERILVGLADAGWADLATHNAAALLGESAAATSTIRTADTLIEARSAVGDEVVARDRMLIVAVLAAATALAGFVVAAGTLAARRDFGRRRALGATQAQLTWLVVLATMWPALIGVVAGTAVGWAYLASRLGHAPGLSFTVSVGVLAVLCVLLASAVPAVAAAMRDPLRVLRVP